MRSNFRHIQKNSRMLLTPYDMRLLYVLCARGVLAELCSMRVTRQP